MDIKKKYKQLFFINLLLITFNILIDCDLYAQIQNNDTTVFNRETLTDTTNTAISDSISYNLTDFSSFSDTLNNNYIVPDKQKREAEPMFEEIIKSTSFDSMIFDMVNKKVILINKCVIDYGNIHLEAGYAELDMTTKVLTAKGLEDSLGVIGQKPIFKDGEQEYRCETIKYNFDTGRGYITGVMTQQGDGYLHGNKIKKMEDDVTNLRNGGYTTCDHEHPHFTFRFTKGKLIPEDKIVTGLTYLEIEDIPLPLGIPFAIFPLLDGGTSGVIIPGYGNSAERGFFLENGGYYWHVNDMLNVKLLGDIYSRGSWAIKPSITYKKRYKYSGSFSFSYAQNKTGIRKSSKYQSRNDFKINWTHTQDPKANPNHSFSANVNFVTSQYNKTNPSTTTDYLSNTFNSSIAYQTSFFNKKLNFSLNAGHTQNTLDGKMTFTFPNFSLSSPKIYPFKKKVASGKQKWYEKIYFSYSMVGKNELTSVDSLLFEGNIWDKMKNGIKHSIPIGYNAKIFNIMQFSVSANYTERWYSKYFDKYYQSDTTYEDGIAVPPHLVEDPIYAFKAARDFNFSTSLNTTIYGMMQFKKFFVRAIRHVVTPSLSFNYTPDFGTEFWNYYDTYTNSYGEQVKYSIFSANGYSPLYGTPNDGESGRFNFSLDNSLEIKVRNKKDTITGTKKIKLIESLRLSTGYDIARDSLNWSDLSISGRTKVIDGLTLEYSTSLCPYKVNENGVKVNQFLWDTDRKLFAPPSHTWRLGFTYSLNQNTFNKTDNQPQAVPDGMIAVEDALTARDVYIDWDNTWSVNISYNFNYVITQKMQNDGTYMKQIDVINAASLSGNVNITDKWKIGYNLKFDIKELDLSYANLSVYRDLHCWEMSFNWVPFGGAKSWSFTINVKAPSLNSLKYEKQKDMRDYL